MVAGKYCLRCLYNYNSKYPISWSISTDWFIFQDDCNTDNDIDLGTNSNLDKHSESNGGDPNVITTCDNSDLVDGESHSIVVQRTGGNVVTSTEIVGQQPPEDLMQNVECELEEPEGEILLVKW